MAFSKLTQTSTNGYYRSIEYLRADDPDFESFSKSCNYDLGERLFINLDRNMTPQNFTTALRNFHQRLSTYEEDEIDQGRSLLRSFCPQCETNPRNLGSAGYTLARYYGEKVFTDTGAPTGSIPGLGMPRRIYIDDYLGSHSGFTRVPATSPDPDLWLRLRFENVVNPPEKVTIRVEQYYEEREPYYDRPQERTVSVRDDGRAYISAWLGSPSGNRRAPGHHWVYIYNENGQKIAEAEYQVLP